MVSETCYRLGTEERAPLLGAITSVLSKRREIVFAFVHGSFLDSPFFRDIDLGLYLKGIHAPNFWDYEAGLAQEIEETLGRRFLIEPKVINNAPLSFCYHVIRGRLLLVRDEKFLVEFMVRVARGYLEMAPLRHRYIAEAMA